MTVRVLIGYKCDASVSKFNVCEVGIDYLFLPFSI